MALSEEDIYELSMWFEKTLNSTTKTIDKQKKMRMRRKIRDETFLLLTWENPSPSAIINRWEERMIDVFQSMPYGFKDELLRVLVAKMGEE